MNPPSELEVKDAERLRMLGERYAFTIGYADLRRSPPVLNFTRSYMRRRTADCDARDMWQTLKKHPAFRTFIAVHETGKLEWIS